MREDFKKQMEEELEYVGVSLTDRQMEQFYSYYELLTEWNKVMNLTAITEQREVVTKHFVDSLSLKRVMKGLGEESLTVADVGTGAGFPGVPLKIAFPKLRVTLLDSLNKRVKFLNEVIARLELSEITAVHGRAEDFGRSRVSRETFDLCVSRAVANLSTLSEYCMPLVKTGGYFVPYKSGKLDEEMVNGQGAIRKLGGEVEHVERFCLPNSDERALVKVKKVKATDRRYPRKAGMPSREPLKQP